MMRLVVVWFGPDCSVYVLFFDLWRASVDAVGWVWFMVGTAPTVAEVGWLVRDRLGKNRVPKGHVHACC